MLGELQGLDKKSEWRKVKASISSDPRYEAVESKHWRQDLFKEYVDNKIVSPLSPKDPLTFPSKLATLTLFSTVH